VSSPLGSIGLDWIGFQVERPGSGDRRDGPDSRPGRPGLIARVGKPDTEARPIPRIQRTGSPSPGPRSWTTVAAGGGPARPGRSRGAGHSSDRGSVGEGRDRGRRGRRRHQQEAGGNPLMARRALAYGATIVNTPLGPLPTPARPDPGACRRARRPRPRVFPRRQWGDPRPKSNGQNGFHDSIFDRERSDVPSSETEMIG
jgi:hypothetical protein